MTDTNLSESLFKPKFEYVETSTISNSGCPLPKLSKIDLAFGFDKHFYRPILKYFWVSTGGNLLDIDEALANICISIKKRSRPECFDTVSDYGPGHWNFEFNTQAQKRFTRALDFEKKNDLIKASHNYRMSARYYSIAAYPYLRHDDLAQTSQAMCINAFKKMFEVDPKLGKFIEINFSVNGKNATAYLITPDTKTFHPCAVTVASYENNITDFFRLYDNGFRPNGIAMMVVDMPGKGGLEKIPLDEDNHNFLENAISELVKLSFIDATNLALIGMNLGGTACIRLAITKQNLFKACSLVSPFVHGVFISKELLDSFPLCLRSSLCNRLNFDASQWNEVVVPQLKVFSLKYQGLVGIRNNCKIPTLLCMVKESTTSKEDLTLLQSTFSDLTVIEHKQMQFSEYTKHSFEKIIEFLKEKLTQQ